MAKWVVDVKGRAGSESFEITVLRDDNEHGKRSYGWIGKDKLLITHNGGPCHWPLTPMVWDKAVKLAHEVADELNAAEGHNDEVRGASRLSGEASSAEGATSTVVLCVEKT